MVAEHGEVHWQKGRRTLKWTHLCGTSGLLIHSDEETNLEDLSVNPLFYGTADPNQASATFFMAEMVAGAHFACTTLGVVLDPKLLSLGILHL